jgi:hypothetical protein
MKALLSLALVGAFTLVNVQAAPVQLASSTEGSGYVEVGKSGDRVGKANLVLKRDGKFTLGFVGGNDTRFSGSWAPSGRDDVSLRISEADGRDARGAGQIELHPRRGEYELHRITINGETSNGRNFTGRFAADHPVRRPVPVPVPVPPPTPVVLDSERAGTGRLQVAGRDNFRISRAHVQLLRNGRAHLHTEGRNELRYEGSWSRGGDGTANVTMAGGLNGERLQGIVRYGYGRVARIDLSGTRSGRYYSLEFDAGR